MGSSTEKLTCVSMVLCDDVYRDEVTKKSVLVGTFNNINTPVLPYTHPRMVVVFSLTNGRGEYNLGLTIQNERSGQDVISLGGPLRVNDPLQFVDVTVVLRSVEFSDAGKYWAVLEADSEILAQRPFLVTHRDQGSGHKGDQPA